jgi:hypothetical protein
MMLMEDIVWEYEAGAAIWVQIADGLKLKWEESEVKKKRARALDKISASRESSAVRTRSQLTCLAGCRS